MTLIIKDRRDQATGKSTGNRQRFLRRVKSTVQNTGHTVLTGNVGNTSSGTSVKVNKSTIMEPSFVYDSGGYHKRVLPGNRKYVKGDKIDLQGSDGGTGSGAGNGGDGEDDFDVQVTRSDYIDFIFEGLVLPNLKKNDDTEMMEYNTKPAGFTTDGPPSRLSILESKKKAKLRKITLTSATRKKVKTAEDELDALIAELEAIANVDELTENLYRSKIQLIRDKIERLHGKIKRIPGLEEVDLRYRSYSKVPIRTSSAVIFFVMDNSGSMGEEEKTLSRKFFTLLYLFVTKRYGNAELVFISHTTSAREVTEEEFFSTRESGGTMVSSALHLVSKIIKERYSAKSTNIYICQASDGDNWDTDNPTCFRELAQNILPRVQHFSYIQVGSKNVSMPTGLWTTYNVVAQNVEFFAAEKITDDTQIASVFRSIFKAPSNGESNG